MIHRRRRSAWAGAALATAIVAANAAGAGAATVIEAPADPLEGPFADAVLVGPRTGEDGGDGLPARLLVLRSPAVDENGVARVALLERVANSGVDWPIVAEQALPSGIVGPAESGFLLALGNDRFVVVAPGADADGPATALLGLTIYRRQVSVWARTRIPIGVDAAGVADSDADGRPELVVLDRPDGMCSGADTRVIDTTDLRDVRQLFSNGYRMAGGALGEFNGLPGVDLAISAIRTCTGAGPRGDSILIQSLADRRVHEIPASPIFARGELLAADVDRDGLDDLVTHTPSGMIVRLAVDGWQPRSIRWEGTPLAAIEDRDGGAWVAGLDDAMGEPGSMRLLHVSAVADSQLVVGVEMLADAIPSATAFTATAIGTASPFHAATGSWSGDVDGDGCPDLLVARLTLLCSSGATIRTGPGWYATTPLGAYGEPGARRLLVAASASWPDPGEPLAAPGPAGDAEAEPRWRDSASGPFLLSELTVADLLYHVQFPVPSVAMGREQASRDELSVTIGGSDGERFFVRTIPLRGATDRGSFEPIADFLDGIGGEPGIRSMQRIPIAPGSNSGASNGFLRLPLDAGVAAHQVSVVGVNDWGEVSALEQTRIDVDRAGPTLVVQAPFVSLPWPLVTRIEGVADPGAQVRIGDGEPVEAARNGSFSIRTSLAPWPQTLEVRATDPAGNETVRPLSVVGGVDYRQLPWEIILGAGVLAGALLAALRSPARLAGIAAPPRRLAAAGTALGLRGTPTPLAPRLQDALRDEPWPGQAYDADGEPIAIIEDLD